MIPALALLCAILAWNATGHGKPLPCAANLCTAAQLAADAAERAPVIPVDMGPHAPVAVEVQP